MYEKDVSIIDVIVILFIIAFFIICVKYGKHYDRYYEYVDLDGNEGITNVYDGCSYDSWGGQGAMVCKLNNGTILQVRSYKYVRE